MFSLFNTFFVLAGVLLIGCPEMVAATNRVLRICADPNNLPFSNERLEGFENKIAEVVAQELNAKLEYSWRAQRRGFFRETLKENTCDLVMGVPAGFERALTTVPYYRSSYVFISRSQNGQAIRSFDDPALRTLRVGVQLIGDDYANTPPAHALSSRGIITNVVGFTIYGDYKEANPPARIIDAVASGKIDVAVVWGPLGGYFARQQTSPLQVETVTPAVDSGFLRFSFAICMGVRKKDTELRDQLNDVIKRRQQDIDRILNDYGVPRIAAPELKARL